MEKSDCIFCKIIKREAAGKIIAENETVIVLKDIAPQALIHYLIIPKQHFRDINSANYTELELIKDCFIMAQQLSSEISDFNGDFKLQINNGYFSGQRVFHLHFHFLAGQEF